MTTHLNHQLTRRALLKWAGVTGASALIPMPLPRGDPVVDTPPARVPGTADLADWIACNPILLVDNRDIIRAIQDTVGVLEGWRILGVLTVHHALEICRTDPISLVITSVHLSGSSGFDLLDTIQADRDLNAIPIIFFSASDQDDNRINALSGGAVDYMVKPAPIDVFRHCVESVLLEHGRWTVIP